ncbi:MAG: hypothetical protein P8N61_03820 [Porticoccaceae bacterium]|nr:hypothetical protein [Porticoccaceae bacterium]
MSDNLDDIDDAEGLDDSDDNSAAVEPENTLTDKQQAQVKLESRRRLELKLEQARLDKQVQEYDFDDDFF